MNKLFCVHCGSDSIHRSRPRTLLERAVRLLGGRTFRCHVCNARFAGFGRSLVRIANVNRAARRLLLGLAMMTAIVAVLGGIVWLSRNQAAFSPNESAIRLSCRVREV